MLRFRRAMWFPEQSRLAIRSAAAVRSAGCRGRRSRPPDRRSRAAQRRGGWGPAGPAGRSRRVSAATAPRRPSARRHRLAASLISGTSSNRLPPRWDGRITVRCGRTDRWYPIRAELGPIGSPLRRFPRQPEREPRIARHEPVYCAGSRRLRRPAAPPLPDIQSELTSRCSAPALFNRRREFGAEPALIS
jgi:hypothetical protein